MITKRKATFSVLTLRDVVLFPHSTVPLFIGREHSINALDYATKYSDYRIFLVMQIDPSVENPEIDQLYKVGVVAEVNEVLKLPDGSVKILVSGEHRAKILKFIKEDNLLKADVEIREESSLSDDKYSSNKVESLRRSVLSEFDIWNKLTKKVQSDVVIFINETKDLNRLTYVIAFYLDTNIKNKQSILEVFDVIKRLEKLLSILKVEVSILNTQRRINNRIEDQIKSSQRVYYLNEHLKAIQKELDEVGSDSGIDSGSISDFENKIKNLDLSEEAREKAVSDLKRYKKVNNVSPEAAVISNYLHWLLSLPWGKYTETNTDINNAEVILNENHYGMEKVKDRIIEFLSVVNRVKKIKGSILCLVGPPGVGKTSFAKSIAQATGRNFVRMSLGGIRDESEIRGHRRTYIGSMPGKIIQHIKKSQSCNPLFLLDEVDKLGYDYRGDPASALLEVLDSEHNKHFVDHYIEVEFDLSNVMFILTANSLNLPRPLIDRMEIINVSGYTENEKVKIASMHIIPGMYDECGLKDDEFSISDDALYDLIRYYTRESGVRNLKREIANLMRKSLRKILKDKEIKKISIDSSNLLEYLGVRKFDFGVIEKNDLVGVVTGLAYTETGGDILTIEAVYMPGKGLIGYTGKLGEVMQESVRAAYSYIRSNNLKFGITSKMFQLNDIHVHVPEGAIPKDGPSAGVAMCVSIISLMTNIPVNKNVSMTGEITLRGRVLAIGGLKEKMLASLRGGIRTIILPEQNRKNVEEVSDEIKGKLNIIYVTSIDEVVKYSLITPIASLEDDEIICFNNDILSNKNNYQKPSPDLLQH